MTYFNKNNVRLTTSEGVPCEVCQRLYIRRDIPTVDIDGITDAEIGRLRIFIFRNINNRIRAKSGAWQNQTKAVDRACRIYHTSGHEAFCGAVKIYRRSIAVGQRKCGSSASGKREAKRYFKSPRRRMKNLAPGGARYFDSIFSGIIGKRKRIICRMK